MKSLFAAIFSLISLSQSQIKLDTTYYEPPKPKNGWESLTSAFAFSEIARRARIEGAYSLRIDVDSSGELLNMKIEGLRLSTQLTSADSFHFVNQIQTILDSISWVPGTWQGKAIRSWAIIPMVFYLRSPGSVPPLIFEGKLRRFRLDGDVFYPIED